MTEFTKFRLSDGHPWEVVLKETGQFVCSNGHYSREKAIEAAKKVATEFPSKTFIVYGPTDEVKANIPVDVKSL